MHGAVLHAPGDLRYEERRDPAIIEPTDAIVRTVATCVCGSDLWPYRDLDEVGSPRAIGHEYCGIVEEVGSDVTSVRPGQLVVGGFLTSDNTCPQLQSRLTKCVPTWRRVRRVPVRSHPGLARRRHIGRHPGATT